MVALKENVTADMFGNRFTCSREMNKIVKLEVAKHITP